MNKSRRKLELEEPDMVEIGKDIMDSEDTDPEDDVPLANLQPVLVSVSKPAPNAVNMIFISGQYELDKTRNPRTIEKTQKEERRACHYNLNHQTSQSN